MVTLRPYQERAVAAVRGAWREGARGVVLVLPTGAGKTVILAEIARLHLARHPAGEVVVFAHRTELLDQARAKLAGLPVRVESIQTAVRRPPVPATLAIFDEAHHLGARDWGALPDGYASAHRLGLTATPQRGDGAPLSGFDRLVVGATVRELTELGHLVPCDVIAPPVGQSDADPVDACRRLARGPTVVFGRSLRHARDIASQLGGECVEGGTDRTAALERFASGAVRVLTNVFVLTEGWDCPSAETAVVARGCTHAGTWLQIIGRVLRPSPGKSRALVIDCSGAVYRHGLPTDDREWSLSGRAHRLAPTEPLKQCGSCGGVARPSRACPACGTEYPPQPLPHATRREFRRVDVTTPVATKRAMLLQLRAIAAERGYAPGWAGYRFRARFGHWPGSEIWNSK